MIFGRYTYFVFCALNLYDTQPVMKIFLCKEKNRPKFFSVKKDFSNAYCII